MHLYGYGRETTPCMDARRRDLIVFKDVRATQTFTGGSLKMFFTDATEERPDRTYSTLAQRYANVGYSCTLISNQERWGRVEGIESLLFSGCREMVYLKEKSRGRYVSDSDLLPELQACLQRQSGPSVVFLHLMGSHFPFASQYPASLAVYPRNSEDHPPCVEPADTRIRSAVDAYDNTILQTDRLLGRVLDQLSTDPHPCFLVYFSDHGETPRSHSVRDHSSPDLYEIPFVVWFSSEYRKLFPNVVKTMEEMAEKSHTADHLLGLFLALARIEEAKRWNE